MKKSIILASLIFTVFSVSAQKYFTKEGKVYFHSKTQMEKIEATNSKATSVIDFSTGAIEWGVLVKAFKFEKALMQEHFNENYLESNKFPKSTFKGKIENVSSIQLGKDGSYPVVIKGTLDMHGVSKPVTANATFVVKGGAISGTSKLKVLLADHNITVPAVVKDNISKEVEISISADYSVFK
ncbi:MAG: YceI family protein [Saprospiraceae bacterium]|nr:YceI family protein [Saprospiraceae bacterium]